MISKVCSKLSGNKSSPDDQPIQFDGAANILAADANSLESGFSVRFNAPVLSIRAVAAGAVLRRAQLWRQCDTEHGRHSENKGAKHDLDTDTPYHANNRTSPVRWYA